MGPLSSVVLLKVLSQGVLQLLGAVGVIDPQEVDLDKRRETHKFRPIGRGDSFSSVLGVTRS